ncbi:aminopeptidase [Salibacteraceae bacterium]|nr:aminopeptidase [Salibacteraceae bacterium]
MNRIIEYTNILVMVFAFQNVMAQYEFFNEKRVECTEVKSQDITGTCWSFSTASFIESELIRQGKGSHNLSEMFVVRSIYQDKARNYMLRQGEANFSQGALAHDLLRVFEARGCMPESAYSGLLGSDSIHNHSELESGLKGFLDGARKGRKLSSQWSIAFDGILNAYLGESPDEFEYNGKSYTPMSFSKSLDIETEDYVSITSFTHHPFDSEFILEIPDNYSNGAYFNVELDELVKAIDNAIEKGFSIAWDGDVSEKTFRMKEGLAIIPKDIKRDSLYDLPGEEIAVTSINRQKNFENLTTTDDHLMHLIGIAQDVNGVKYYIIKNSWGEMGHFDGYLYMSESYLRMKTIGLLMHKDALPKSTLEKIKG